MFWLFGKKRVELLEEETKNSFQQVKNDIAGVGKWIKHLDSKDKQVFEILGEIIETSQEKILKMNRIKFHSNKNKLHKRIIS